MWVSVLENHGLSVHLNIITADISSDPIAGVFLVEGSSYRSEHASWRALGCPVTWWPCDWGLSLCISSQALCPDMWPPLEAGKILTALGTWHGSLRYFFCSCRWGRNSPQCRSITALPWPEEENILCLSFCSQLKSHFSGYMEKGMQPCRLFHWGGTF